MRRFERDPGLPPDARLTRDEKRLLERHGAGSQAPPPEAPAAPAEGAVPVGDPTAPIIPQAPAIAEVPGAAAQLTPEGLAIPPADAPQAVRDVILAGNEIALAPYRYGGGHGADWEDTGYDCSGSMSYALHGGDLLDVPLISTDFGYGYGVRGKGRWITTYGHGGHSYMTVAGLRFDTTARKETGSRWTDEARSPRGYGARHPRGL